MKKCLRVLWRTVIMCVVVLLIAAAYFMLEGIPTPVVRRYLAQLEDRHHLRITVGKAHWRPWHQFTARNVYVATDSGNLTAEVETVVIDLGPTPDIPSELSTLRCRISEAHVNIAAETEAPATSIRLVSGELARFPDGHTRLNVTAMPTDGWLCTINGVLGAPANGSTGALSTIGQRLAEGAGRAHASLLDLNRLREERVLPESLIARVMFESSGADSKGTRAWAWIEGGPMLIHGLAISNCSASLQWTNGVVKIDSIRAVAPNASFCIEGRGTFRPQSSDLVAELRVQASPADFAAVGLLASNHLAVARQVGPLDAHLDVSGRLRDIKGMNVTFHASSLPGASSDSVITVADALGQYSNGLLHIRQLSLVSSDPMACLPEPLRTSIAGMGLHSVGPVHADLSLGPARLPDITGNVSGRVTCSKLGYRATELASVDVGFRRNGRSVNIVDATAVIQGDGSDRSVTVRGAFDLDGACALYLASDAEPAILATLLPTNMAPFVESFEVSGTSRTEVEVLWTRPRAADLTVRGTMHATDLARYGVRADLLHASFVWTNRTVQVDDLAIVRADGRVTGRFTYRPDERLLSIDTRSTTPVLPLARFVAPGLEQMLSSYRFEGPATIECRGTIGLRDNPTRDLRLHVDGKSIGWRWFLADTAVLDVLLGERTTVAQVLDARWCNGHVTGSLEFERSTQTNEPGRCNLDLLVIEADLATVVDVFRDVEDAKAYEGDLSGHVTLTGDAGPQFLQSATGSGRIDIRDGYILSIPLFGGLSKYLSVLIPRIGFASQRDLRGNFLIREGRVETSDAELLGKLITIRGKGSYAFSGDINARAQVQFLKEGLTATVTRLITSPLTKALEFEVSGTGKEPHWRPVNTPDRLLKFFSENLGRLVPSPSKRGDAGVNSDKETQDSL